AEVPPGRAPRPARPLAERQLEGRRRQPRHRRAGAVLHEHADVGIRLEQPLRLLPRADVPEAVGGQRRGGRPGPEDRRVDDRRERREAARIGPASGDVEVRFPAPGSRDPEPRRRQSFVLMSRPFSRAFCLVACFWCRHSIGLPPASRHACLTSRPACRPACLLARTSSRRCMPGVCGNPGAGAMSSPVAARARPRTPARRSILQSMLSSFAEDAARVAPAATPTAGARWCPCFAGLGSAPCWGTRRPSAPTGGGPRPRTATIRSRSWLRRCVSYLYPSRLPLQATRRVATSFGAEGPHTQQQEWQTCAHHPHPPKSLLVDGRPPRAMAVRTTQDPRHRGAAGRCPRVGEWRWWICPPPRTDVHAGRHRVRNLRRAPTRVTLLA